MKSGNRTPMDHCLIKMSTQKHHPSKEEPSKRMRTQQTAQNNKQVNQNNANKANRNENLKTAATTKPMNVMFWNSRSLKYPKPTFIASRKEDIICLNETWLKGEDKPNINGYNAITKNRTKQTGGGVAILLEENMNFKEIETSVKETLIVKVNIERNKKLFIITSYFPAYGTNKWKRRWSNLMREILDKCSESSLENIIITGDFNHNLEEDQEIIKELKQMRLSIVPLGKEVTHIWRGQESKIDFFIASDNVLHESTISTEQGLASDHKIICIKVKRLFQYPKGQITTPNRKLAMETTIKALYSSNFSLKQFALNHQHLLETTREVKWKKIIHNKEYKDKIKNLVREKNFDVELIKKELEMKWDLVWKEVQKQRYSKAQKQAFAKIRTLTKYHTFEKRDGSIINKVLVNGSIVTLDKEVNAHLKEALEILTGKDSEPTYRKSSQFPRLPMITKETLVELAKGLKKNKAIANDFIEDTSIYENIERYAVFAEMFTHLWDPEILNTEAMKRCLTGRLIPLNKVHPLTPLPTQMRPIIALSPILKILEIRFKSKLDRYLNERLVKAQTGFVQNCGTQINIMRLIGKGMQYKDRKQKACILFIDFKSAYNNVNLEKLFEKLIVKNILEPAEVEFLRALYSNTIITIGKNERLQVNKGVLQGSVISPSLFDIFVEELVEEMVGINMIENVFAFADDLAAIVDSDHRLDLTIETIERWSETNKTPLNYEKSGILNILCRRDSTKMIKGKKDPTKAIKKSRWYRGFPVVKE